MNSYDKRMVEWKRKRNEAMGRKITEDCSGEAGPGSPAYDESSDQGGGSKPQRKLGYEVSVSLPTSSFTPDIIMGVLNRKNCVYEYEETMTKQTPYLNSTLI